MCNTITSCILIATNVVVILLGLGSCIIGGTLQWGQSQLKKHIEGASKFFSKISGSHVKSGTAFTLTEITSLLGEYYLSYAGAIIFIFGILILIVGLCGAVGVIRKSTPLLAIYTACCGVILCGMIVLTCILAFKKNAIKMKGKSVFKEYIKNKFVGVNGVKKGEPVPLLSIAMKVLGCCGIVNGSDFNPTDSPKWNRSYHHPDERSSITMKIPLSCCKFLKEGFTPKDTKCLTDPNQANSNIHKGCFTQIWSITNLYYSYIVYGLVGACTIMLLLIVFTASRLIDIRREKEIREAEQNYQWETPKAEREEEQNYEMEVTKV